MSRAVVSFTGFRDRVFVNHLASLVHWMGGSVRRRLDADVTHLVAYRCAGEKVRKAALTSTNITTVNASWIESAWDLRISNPFFDSTETEFVNKHRAKVFQSCCIFFVGFPQNSRTVKELKDLVQEHNGSLANSLRDECLTHVIVSDEWPATPGSPDMSDLIVSSPNTNVQESDADATQNLCSELKEVSFRVPVLRLDWFWKSLQCTYICHPRDYLCVPADPQPSTTLQLESQFGPTLSPRSSVDPFSPPSTNLRSSSSPTDVLLPEAGKENMDPHKEENSQFHGYSTGDLPTAVPKSPAKVVNDGQSLASEAGPTECNRPSSRHDLVAQLADPLNLRSNRVRYQSSSVISCTPAKDTHSLVSPLGSAKTVPLSARTAGRTSEDLHYLLTTSQLSNSASILDATYASDVSCQRRCLSTGFSPMLLNARASDSGGLSTVTPTVTSKSPNPNLSRTPLEALKSSFEHSPLYHRSSPSITTESGTPVQIRLERRKHRVFEFFVTERNYVNVLEYLTQTAFSEVVNENQVGGAILPRAEAEIVFGKLVPVYSFHKRLQESLEILEVNWDNETSRLGGLLLPHVEEMDRVYCHYTQFYSAPHLKQLGDQYPRFLAFMRQVERRKESGRQSLSDLLIRPVQRLPSMLLLMQGIMKFTPASHPDHTDIRSFVEKLEGVLSNIDARLKKNDELISLLTLYHKINGAPPEMLSSSRSLISSLNVFQLSLNAAGQPCLEPVTLFLLTDSLEVARPKKRHTGEPMAHAIQAAVDAIQGESHEPGGHEDTSHARAATEECTGGGDHVSTSVTRTGSGASNSTAGFGRGDGKRRYLFSHLFMLKLQDIKRVLNLSTQSPERAAFSLIVRGSSELNDHVYTFCLAASFTATAAVASGRCPEALESVVATATASVTNQPVLRHGSVKEGQSSTTVASDHARSASVNNVSWSPQSAASQPAAAAASVLEDDVIDEALVVSNPAVATLQHCVSEAKASFLRRLCHHIVQVSCLVNNPDELLTDIPPDELLDFDLETVFTLANVSLKSKKFSRQLGRAISMKTPRRIAAAWSGSGHPAGRSTALSVDRIGTSKGSNTMATVKPYASRPEAEISLNQETSKAPSTPLLSAKLNAEVESMVTPEAGGVTDPLTAQPSSPPCSSSSTPLERQPTSDTFLQPIAPPPLPPQPTVRPTRGPDELWLEREVTEFASDAEDDADDGGDADDFDLVSLDSSSNMGPWPAFLPRPLSQRPARLGTVGTPSTSSLRSTYSLDPHAISGKQEHQGASAIRSRCNRPSVGGGLGGDGATRKSICRSMLDGLRTLRRSLADPKLTGGAEAGLMRGRKSVSGHDLASRPRAPIAETEGNSLGEDNSKKSKTGNWLLARHRLPRLGSVDARRAGHSFGVSTPTLDKSVSECNLSAKTGARNLSTTSTTSLKNLFSPFRVPNGPMPLIRQSTALPGNCMPSNVYHHRTEVLGCAGNGNQDDSASSHSIGSWNSLMTLDEEEAEEDEDCPSARRRRGGHLSKTPVETCSLILPPSSSGHKKHSLGSRVRGRGSKSSKKRGGVFLLGSAIFHKSAQSEGQQTDFASRRESFFKRGFLRK
nr:unnamed protein product [Spirometra erinaceieuropaei]